MSTLAPRAWVNGYVKRGDGPVTDTLTADYSLLHLIRNGYIPAEDGYALLSEAGLDDFVWQVTWPEDFWTPDERLTDMLTNAQGYVIFVHGWTGNHLMWEQLPGMVVTENRKLVAFSIDHNGFGQSSFTDHTPELDSCNPPAAMTTLQRWVDLIKIRRQPGEVSRKVVNFVGHSMGGATLFYLNPILWNFGEETRYSLAPALLLDDEMYRAFFTTLGIGIGILERFRSLDFVGNALKPTVVRALCEGASDYVKQLHSAQYSNTPRGITGATFMAMGRLKNREIAHSWDLFRVMLGHKDRLVGLTGMIDLLGKMEFPVANIRVVPGSHYMFSIGTESPANAFLHAQNRELVVRDVLRLHNEALEMQKKGRKYG